MLQIRHSILPECVTNQLHFVWGYCDRLYATQLLNSTGSLLCLRHRTSRAALRNLLIIYIPCMVMDCSTAWTMAMNPSFSYRGKFSVSQENVEAGMSLETRKPYQLPHGISQALCVIVLSAMSAQRIFLQLVSTCYLSMWDKLWPKDRPHPGNHDTNVVTHPPGDETPQGQGDNSHLASRTRGQSQQTGEWVLQRLICLRYVLES